MHGGSLHFWREVFGTNVRAIGVEINKEAKKWEREGFEIHIGNQGDKIFGNEYEFIYQNEKKEKIIKFLTQQNLLFLSTPR